MKSLLKGLLTLNLNAVWIILFLCVITLPTYLVVLIVGIGFKSNNGVHWIGRYYMRAIVVGGFIWVKVEGAEKFDHHKHYIFAANHSSVFDILVLLAYVPIQFRWLAKEELFTVPIYGRSLTLAGAIPVNRSSPRAAVRSIQQAAEKIKQGLSVIIFPEGTRSKDGRIAEFKRGGFNLAVQTGLPIVPVSISGIHRVMPAKTLKVRPGRVKLVFGDPIPTEGVSRKDQNELAQKVRDVMLANHDIDYGVKSKETHA